MNNLTTYVIRYTLILPFILLNSIICFSDEYPDFEKIIDDVRSSVVNIKSIPRVKSAKLNNDKLLNMFLKERKSRPVIGSGFFISSDGYIVTEYDVIRNPGKVEVTLDDGRKYLAKVVGFDKATSIGLLKIQNNDYPVMDFGDANKLKAGQWMMAVGSPFGMENIVTIGVVSSVDTSKNKYQGTGYIVNNVTINPGNGGGPLINGKAEIVGMNTMILTRTRSFNGLSFALPINDIIIMVEKLKKGFKRN